MNRIVKLSLATILVLGSGAGIINCDSEGGGSAFSCTMEGMVCTEYAGSGYDSMALQESCTQGNGTFSMGPCMLGGAVGRCDYDIGGTSEHSLIYYTGVAQTYAEDCEAAGGSWTPLGG